MLKALIAIGALFGAGAALADIPVPMAYLRQEIDLPPTLSNLDPVPDDLGLAGRRSGWPTMSPPTGSSATTTRSTRSRSPRAPI